jgi:hypothetical protein
MQGDLDAIISNPMASVLLKWLRFKVVRRALLNSAVFYFLCSMVTMATKLFTVVNSVEVC